MYVKLKTSDYYTSGLNRKKNSTSKNQYFFRNIILHLEWSCQPLQELIFLPLTIFEIHSRQWWTNEIWTNINVWFFHLLPLVWELYLYWIIWESYVTYMYHIIFSKRYHVCIVYKSFDFSNLIRIWCHI